MAGLTIEQATLAIIIGVLAAIVYALRVVVLLEKRLARIDYNIESLVKKVELEEEQILGEEKRIEKSIKKRRK
jgi:hypothetical protein